MGVQDEVVDAKKLEDENQLVTVACEHNSIGHQCFCVIFRLLALALFYVVTNKKDSSVQIIVVGFDVEKNV